MRNRRVVRLGLSGRRGRTAPASSYAVSKSPSSVAKNREIRRRVDLVRIERRRIETRLPVAPTCCMGQTPAPAVHRSRSNERRPSACQAGAKSGSSCDGLLEHGDGIAVGPPGHAKRRRCGDMSSTPPGFGDGWIREPSPPLQLRHQTAPEGRLDLLAKPDDVVDPAETLSRQRSRFSSTSIASIVTCSCAPVRRNAQRATPRLGAPVPPAADPRPRRRTSASGRRGERRASGRWRACVMISSGIAMREIVLRTDAPRFRKGRRERGGSRGRPSSSALRRSHAPAARLRSAAAAPSRIASEGRRRTDFSGTACAEAAERGELVSRRSRFRSAQHLRGALVAQVAGPSRGLAQDRGRAPRGSSGLSRAGAVGARLRIASKTTAVVYPSNACLPVEHLVEHGPEGEEVASRASSRSPRACSGDM